MMRWYDWVWVVAGWMTEGIERSINRADEYRRGFPPPCDETSWSLTRKSGNVNKNR